MCHHEQAETRYQLRLDQFSESAAVVRGKLQDRENLHVHHGRIGELDRRPTLAERSLNHIELEVGGVDEIHIIRPVLREHDIGILELQRLEATVADLPAFIALERLEV